MFFGSLKVTKVNVCFFIIYVKNNLVLKKEILNFAARLKIPKK